MPVPAVPDALDRTARPAGVLVQAVLDRVPGERFVCERLGFPMDLASP